MFNLERLREIGESWRSGSPPTSKDLGTLLVGAANEIKRLQAHVEILERRVRWDATKDAARCMRQDPDVVLVRLREQAADRRG